MHRLSGSTVYGTTPSTLLTGVSKSLIGSIPTPSGLPTIPSTQPVQVDPPAQVCIRDRKLCLAVQPLPSKAPAPAPAPVTSPLFQTSSKPCDVGSNAQMCVRDGQIFFVVPPTPIPISVPTAPVAAPRSNTSSKSAPALPSVTADEGFSGSLVSYEFPDVVRFVPAASRLNLPAECSFITEPRARLRQCIKLLPCDFTGLAKDKLVEQYVKSCSVEVVTSNVLRLLGDRSLEVLKAPIKDRARAVSMLPEIDQQHNGRGVYANVLEIPARSIFWEYAADMVKLYEGNENDYVPVMYIGSAARLIQCFYKRLFLCHEKEHHGARYPCLHHDAWKAADSHKFVKFAEGGPEDPPGLLRITEAVTTGSHRKESLPRKYQRDDENATYTSKLGRTGRYVARRFSSKLCSECAKKMASAFFLPVVENAWDDYGVLYRDRMDKSGMTIAEAKKLMPVDESRQTSLHGSYVRGVSYNQNGQERGVQVKDSRLEAFEREIQRHFE